MSACVNMFSSRSTAKLPSVSLVTVMDREKSKAAPGPVNLPSERGSSVVKISVGALRTSDMEETPPSKGLEQEKTTVTDYFADDLK